MEEKELENIEETALEAVEEVVEEAAQETSVAEAAEDAQETETAEVEAAEESPAEETTEVTEDSEVEPEPAGEENISEEPEPAAEETISEEPEPVGEENISEEPETPAKKSKKPLVLGIVLGVVIAAIVAAAIIVILKLNKSAGAEKTEAIVSTFIDGVNEVDSDKMYGVLDAASSTYETMADFIDYIVEINDSGITYTMEYSISSVYQVVDYYTDTILEELYDGDESVKIKDVYICVVDTTATVAYDGESSSSDGTMSMICYKKGSKWYLAGWSSSEE